MLSPKARYLKEVLGVKSLILPEDFQASAALEAQGNPQSENIAFCFEPITDDNYELVQKMFSSVGKDDFYLVNHATLNPKNKADLLQNRKLAWVYGKNLSMGDITEIYVLPALKDLMSSQTAKRSAWNTIKHLK